MENSAAEAKKEAPKKVSAGVNQKNTPKKELNKLYKKYHKQPLQMNKIVCSNFHGKGFGCNSKYIVNELLKRNRDLDIVWLVTDKYEFPDGVRTVPFNSEEAIKEIATARVLIDNQMKFPGFLKRDDQFFINTWHGAIPLKKIGFDNPSNKGKKKYENRARLNFENIDLIPSNSRFCSDMFRRSFRYHGFILKQGCPRNDLFFEDNAKYKKEIYAALNIPADKKIAMYAPTFRSDKSLDAYQMDYEKVLKALGDDYVMVLRLHPHVQKKAKNIEYNDKVYNGSIYPDMQVLMAASDVMMTDYSNIMFEFMLSGRPCYIYATDIEEYRKQRDYYFDIYDLPFPVATTSDELAQKIKDFDEIKYRKKSKKFMHSIRMKETGHASEYVADIIEGMTSDKNYNLYKNVTRLNMKNLFWKN